MVFIALFLSSFTVLANDSTSYNNSGFEVVEEQSSLAPSVSVTPKLRPMPPPAPVRPITPEIPSRGGREPIFTDTSKRDRRAPIFTKFQKVFKECSGGCDAAWAHTYRSGAKNSCHAAGHAIDVHGVICNGVKRSAASKRFQKIVNCIRGKSYKGRRWTALHRENTLIKSRGGKVRRDCRGAGPTRKQTHCHWDHAHFSVGCWVNGRRSW